MMRQLYAIMIATAALMLHSCSTRPSYKSESSIDQYPMIWPDYTETTIPEGIAPLNFSYSAQKDDWQILEIKGSISGSCTAEGKILDIDIDQWHSLLSQNKGGHLEMALSVISGGHRINYKPFAIYVSDDPLDEYGLTYRLVEPGYVGYGMMGIYQRNLHDFTEEAIYTSKFATGSCVNCHTPNRTNSSQATFHVRGANGFTMVRDDESTHYYDMRTDSTIANCVYPYWHHSGNYIAYSNNLTYQTFHWASKNRIEVFDNKSDVVVFDVKKQEIILQKQTMVDSISETYPAFSPDGNTLYYCQAPSLRPQSHLEDMHYCLMSARFNGQTGRIEGEPDTLLAIPGKSIAFPRPSYDGRFLMFTVCDYGTFPIWHHEADLYMIDLQSKDSLNVFPAQALNSNDTESFHNWSANSKWVVISSRRDDGLYTRLYLAHVNNDGTFTKPFMLPQKNPARYYKNLFYSYNTPDFCDKEFKISPTELRQVANSPERESVKVR